jgi:hypothetical protein
MALETQLHSSSLYVIYDWIGDISFVYVEFRVSSPSISDLGYWILDLNGVELETGVRSQR